MTLGLWVVGIYLTGFALIGVASVWFGLRKRTRERHQMYRRRLQARSQAFN